MAQLERVGAFRLKRMFKQLLQRQSIKRGKTGQPDKPVKLAACNKATEELRLSEDVQRKIAESECAIVTVHAEAVKPDSTVVQNS